MPTLKPPPAGRLRTAISFYSQLSREATGYSLLAFAMLLAVLVSIAAESRTIAWVDHANEVVLASQKYMMLLTEAETGQRGYVLTGAERYLEPYERAVSALRAQGQRLRTLTTEDPSQQRRLERLQAITEDKLRVLAETVRLRREQGEAAAKTLVLSDRGRQAMEAARSVIAEIDADENTNLTSRIRQRRALLAWLSVLAFATTAVGLTLIVRAIGSRVRLHGAVSESESQFRTLANSMPQLCWIADSDGWIFWYNQRWYEYTGATPEQMAGWGWKSVHDPSALPAVMERWKTSIATGTPLEMVFPLRGADGVFRPFLTRVVPMRNERGRVVRWFGTNTEIGEQQRIEQALREAEERLRLAQQVARVGAFEWNIQAGTNRWTPELEALYGLPEGGFAQSLQAWEDLVYPQDRAGALDKLRIAMESGGFEAEWRTVWPDGSMHWLAARGWVFFDDAHKPLRMVGVNIDITEQKEAEQALRESEARYSTLAEALPAIIFTSSPGGEVTYVNSRWREYTGHTFGESSPGGVSDLIHPEDRDTAEAIWRESIKNESTYEMEFRLRRADGVYRWFRSRAVPLRNEHGRVERWLGIMSDSEDEKRGEERLLQVQKMEATGRLAGGVAHDFNNLLTAITGYNDLVMTGLPPDSKLLEYSREVHGAAQRAAELTGQLLAFGRRQASRPKVLNPNDAVLNVRKLLSRVIGEHIEMVTNLDPELGSARLDPSQLDQVILNLAVNARDAMSSGGLLTFETVNVSISRTEAREMRCTAGEYVVLRVRDTGAGMDAETKRRLFEPFFTTKAPGKGTGLGSSIVYGIVQQSGGFITVDSEPGQGSTFSIHFPRIRSEVDKPVAAGEGSSTRRGKGETILLVEDELAVRHLASTLLRGKGYRVLEAPSPGEAIELVSGNSGPIYLLLTDVLMPGMRGNELARRIRELRPGLPVLYMSGYSDSTFLAPGALEGAAFLQKPFTVTDLLEGIERALRACESARPDPS